MLINSPNLDCMTIEDLTAFVESECKNSNLRFYARTKIAAMKARDAGNIVDATRLESECQKIYNRLPSYQQW